MSVVKNRSTPQGAEFWDHVESIAAQERRQQVNEKAEAARIERLSDAELDAELRSTQEAVIAALQAEVDALKADNAAHVHDLGHLQSVNCKLQAEVARLSAPVTGEELTTCLDERQKLFGPESIQAWFDRLILLRATPPQDVENGGKQ